MRTLAHMYDDYRVAQDVVTELEGVGLTHDQVSIVASQRSASEEGAPGRLGTAPVDEAIPADEAGGAVGASIGTLLGGGAGLLAGIGALAIPGVGPVVAAGWLVALLAGAGAGAAAGGLLGSLAGAGIPEEHAHVYAEGVRRGSTLLTVRAEDTQAAQAEAIMTRYRPVDVAARGAAYRSNEWGGFDEVRGTMTDEELAAERARVLLPNMGTF